MLLLLGAAFALHLQVPASARRDHHTIVRDSGAVAASDSGAHRHRRDGVRRPVTAELRASAFEDAQARTLLLRARTARMAQDSSLTGYDADAYERLSVGMGFGRIGRDHLLFRHESATRVQWQRGRGIRVDVKGARIALPMAPESDQHLDPGNVDDDVIDAIPYFPGAEPLWVGDNTVRAQVNDRDIVNPLADGSEAYYTFATGDSASFTLPNHTVVRLRELRVRPRAAQWNLAVGSLWFDVSSGQLVRAAYRLAVPIDIWQVAKADDSTSMDDVPRWIKPMLTPMTGEVSGIAIEYGLHEGRFWLPSLRAAEGSAQVSFMHVPFKIEEHFTYNAVNGSDTLPAIVVPASDSMSESVRDSIRADERRARRHHDEHHVRVCDTTDTVVVRRLRFDGTIPVMTRVPCDVRALEHSAALPPSIYDPGDELFDAKDRDQLLAQAQSMGMQPPLQLGALPPPSIAYGPSLMRYNRVEGLSLGASVNEQLGGGYDAGVVARFGLADREPNVELTLTRTNLTDSIHVRGYNRLVSASDWGSPLSFGSSVSALLFGRDEGFYYRASGAEISGSRDTPFGGTHFEWRGFIEEQRTATPRTDFAIDGADFPPNLVARTAVYGGVGGRILHAHGLDPRGLRLLTDLRFEAAASDSVYGRAALDVTASHGLGPLAGSLTVAGGGSVGALPPQRRWYLGGLQTVRGQSPDTAQSGNAFWLTRAELGTAGAGVRPTIFGDLGWVGDRTRIRDVGRPLSGVGAGVSFLDGLFRFDVARGLYPRNQWRIDLSLESRF